MNKYELALFKRCMDWYTVDPAFRRMMNQKPEEAIRRLGFTGQVDPLLAREAIRFIVYRKDEEGTAEKNPCVLALQEFQKPIMKWVKEMHEPSHIASRDLSRYLDYQRERCQKESELIRNHPMVYYFPFCIELSHGCRIQCPFCGLKAEPYKESFLYTKENADLYKEILTALKEYTGDLGGCCPQYFATEPLDNPDYEKFLTDMKSIFGHMPQTTTAAADLDPVRVKRFMASSPEEELYVEALWRFSIRSLAQFKKIMAHYSPEDLLYVELLANNPESVNRYSDSGRARRGAGIGGGIDASTFEAAQNNTSTPAKPNAAYSISCIAGLKINMADRTMAFIEPVVPDEAYPLGYRVLDEAVFADGPDFKKKLARFVELYVK